MADKRLIVALDVPNFAKMQELVNTLGDAVSFYKVGMELFYAEGTKVLTYLKENNKNIFLDLKLHDIPNTVAQGTASLIPYGFDFLTIHAQGGLEMMRKAVEAAKNKAEELNIERPKLLGITVLTSFDEESWQDVGGSLPIEERVVKLALVAQKAGMDGVVASAQEAKLIREAVDPNFLIVTPGIRPEFAQANDQKRVATPATALSDGATHLVIGRPITKADKPYEAAKLIVQEMEAVK